MRLRTPTVGSGLSACLVLAAALALSACGGQDPSVVATTDASPSVVSSPSALASVAAGPTAAAATPAGPTAAPSPDGVTIDVRYAGGQVSGAEGRVPVPVGEQVVVRIASDVADEVHLHGYDLRTDVAAGGSSQIAFTADIPGIFEVELHSTGKLLFQLQVS